MREKNKVCEKESEIWAKGCYHKSPSLYYEVGIQSPQSEILSVKMILNLYFVVLLLFNYQKNIF